VTLNEHPQYWRTVAAQERQAGNERLADDYDRLADVAESFDRLLEDDATTAEVV
jgi:hypothetical protein